MRFKRLTLCVIALGMTCSCAKPKPQPIIVGSKDSSAQMVLAETIAQHIEKKLGQPVERHLNMGTARNAHEALISSQIDLYPEDIAAARTTIFRMEPTKDPAIALESVKQEYQRQHLEWVTSLGFENTFALVVTDEYAREHKLASLSDAAAKDGWKLAASIDFLDRGDGYGALQRAYKLSFGAPPNTTDRKSAYTALAEYKVTMLAGSMADGALAGTGLRALQDDKSAFGPSTAGIVARGERLEQVPGLRAALQELSGRFRLETLRAMSAAVDRGASMQRWPLIF